MPGSNQEYKMCLKLETCRKKEKCLSDRTLCRLSSEKEFRLQGSSIQLSDFVHVVLLGVQRPGLDTCFWLKCPFGHLVLIPILHPRVVE